MTDQLAALAERVEREEPSREIDTAVWLAVIPGATRKKTPVVHTASGTDYVIDETRDASRRLIIVPSYTSSLDAADMLRPAGWILDQIFDIGRNGETTTAMFYKDHLADKVGGVATGPHAEARARLAAALRALAAAAPPADGGSDG